MIQARYKNDNYLMTQSFNHTGKSFLTKRSEQTSPQRVKGQNGSTWDARHLSKFLYKSQYSDRDALSFGNSRTSALNLHQSHPRANLTSDHFFKTTKDNKNSSKFGYTSINPLVSNVETQRRRANVIQDFLENGNLQPRPAISESLDKFRFQSNSLKFHKTDPLTSRHLGQSSPTNFEKLRMIELIRKHHPHGITGIDHPQNPQTKYYRDKVPNDNIRIRKQPNSNKSHIIDPLWKSKGKIHDLKECPIYGGTKVSLKLARKFNNDNAHGFDIVSNRVAMDIGRKGV